MSSPAARCGFVHPVRRSGRTGLGAPHPSAASLALPRIQSLSRMWGAPSSAAERQRHSASYPSASRSRMTTSSPSLSSPVEFSAKTHVGLTSPTMRDISFQSPDLSPLMPALLPSGLQSWQGKPPHTTSQLPCQARPSNVRTSSHIGNGSILPSFWRDTRTDLQYSSSSTAQTVLHPSSNPPRTPPPDPAKRWIALRPCLSSTSCPFISLFMGLLTGYRLVHGCHSLQGKLVASDQYRASLIRYDWVSPALHAAHILILLDIVYGLTSNAHIPLREIPLIFRSCSSVSSSSSSHLTRVARQCPSSNIACWMS